MSSGSRVHGTAKYSARIDSRTGLIELTASGILPCYNYEAQLEMRPERILPPMWDMIFYTQNVCLTAIKPFCLKVRMAGAARSITVHDATGPVQVPVQSVTAKSNAVTLEEALAAPVKYFVYSRLPVSPPHGCIVVPEGAIVLAIYAPVFGPSSKAKCDAWAAANCSVARGGEVPWPMADIK
jgi:hypothetical protein